MTFHVVPAWSLRLASIINAFVSQIVMVKNAAMMVVVVYAANVGEPILTVELINVNAIPVIRVQIVPTNFQGLESIVQRTPIASLRA